MTAGAEWPGAAEYAAWYARFAEAVANTPREEAGEPLRAELHRYLEAFLRASGAAAPDGLGTHRLRSLLTPLLERLEAEYQAFARSPVVLASMQQAVATTAVLPSPAIDPLAKALHTLSHGWGLPAQTTPRIEVWREGTTRLYRYGVAGRGSGPALVLLYAQINRPSILDLEPGHSLVEGLVAAGRDVYLLDWGDPAPEDHDRTLAQWLHGRLHRAIRAVAGRRKVDLLGICQGGVFALLYTATHPARVRRLVTMVTPVDFQVSDDLVSLWARACGPAAVHDGHGVSGAALNVFFQMLAPFRQGVGKYLDLLDHLGDPQWVQRFRRMERWVHDCPDPPREVLRAFLADLYRDNALVRGTLQLDGRPVDLARIHVPLLNLYGVNDHIVPPAASRALCGLTASRRYEEWALPVGHIGVFVSDRAAAVPTRIAAWLDRR